MKSSHFKLPLLLALASIATFHSGCMIGGKPINGKLATTSVEPATTAVTPIYTAFSTPWPFDALSTALYVFSGTEIQFTGGVAELIPTVQTDSATTEASASTYTNGAKNGVTYGTLTDGSTLGLKLGDSGACNGATTNCSELESSWTPQWGSLVAYLKLTGTGTLTNGDAVNAAPLGNATAAITGAVNSGYNTGKIGTGLNLVDGNGYLNFGDNLDIRTNNFTNAMWIKTTDTAYHLISKSAATAATNRWFTIYAANDCAGSPGVGVTGLFSAIQAVGCGVVCTYPATGMNDGRWHHIVTTYTRNENMRFYVDAVEKSAQSISGCGGVDIDSSFAAYVGNYGGNPGTSPISNGTFTGSIDEVAVWSAALTATEIKTIYERQAPAYAGTFTSRIMNAKSDSAAWSTFSWAPTLPYLKELPDYASGAIQNESSHATTGYSSLVGSTGATGANDLMTGIVGLWHLNESVGVAGAGSIKDDSGNGKHGTPVGSVAFGGNGKFLTAPTFVRGTSDAVSIPAIDLSATAVVTISFWLKQVEDGLTDNKLILELSGNMNLSDVGFITTADPGVGTAQGGVGRMMAGYWGNAGYNIKTFDRSRDGHWHHFAYIFNKANAGASEISVYVDGVPAANQYQEYASNSTNGFGNVALFMMSRAGTSSFNSGSLDEVALWSRALHANEILQLYQRGAARLKLQVRTCDDNACAGESWQGPDGTSNTYFSELHNNTTALTGAGDVKAALPSLLLSQFTSPPINNPYFQYRTIFESDSATTAHMPELKSTTVDPVHYPAYLSTNTSPGNTIIGTNGIPFYSLSAFYDDINRLISPDLLTCPSGVLYNIGASSTGPWKYWNGATWAAADGSSAQANSSSVIHSNIGAYGTQFGTGSVYFKAFLQSSSTSKCELNNIQVDGTQ